MMTTQMAFDRSMRNYDQATGHLHIESSNISKACVSPYLGREIPDWQNLGLDAEKVYYLYRDPGALESAAPAFEGKPILIQHKAISADQPAKDLVVGAIGKTTYQHPYLKAALTFWTRDAISAIESGEQQQLSCGYGYRAQMVPGVVDGVRYDGRMMQIGPNHLALVETGRVGPDVFVADSLPTEFSHMTPEMIAALKPFLVADVDLVALDAAMKDCEGEDESEEEEEEKPKAKDKSKAKDKKMGKDESEEEEEKPKAKDKKAKDGKAKDGEVDHRNDFNGEKDKAKDEATVTVDQMKTAIKASTDAAVKRVEDLHNARKAVEPICGVVALDSADAVYEFALKHLQIDTKDVPPAAFPALLNLAKQKTPTPRIGMDSAGAANAATIWPVIGTIRAAF
jgi:hypothetical protein